MSSTSGSKMQTLDFSFGGVHAFSQEDCDVFYLSLLLLYQEDVKVYFLYMLVCMKPSSGLAIN